RAEGVAPAIIGRRINALEQRLGVKLMRRTTRKITLTNEGEAFLDDCQRILSDLQNAEASVSERATRASGHLIVSAPAGFGRRHVCPRVPTFLAAHPEVRAALSPNARVVNLVAEGRDVAIRTPGQTGSSRVGSRLADKRRVVVAAPSYPATHGRPEV